MKKLDRYLDTKIYKNGLIVAILEAYNVVVINYSTNN